MRRLAMLLALLWHPALAQTLPQVRIVDYGEFVASRELGPRDPVSPGEAQDPVMMVEEPRIVDRTTRIEARLCLRFGMMFTVDGLGPTDTLALTARSEHPPMLHPDGRVSTGAAYVLQADGSRPSLVGFAFDDPWELAAGPWTFTVMLGDAVLAEQRFDVVVPDGPARMSRARCSSVVS